MNRGSAPDADAKTGWVDGHEVVEFESAAQLETWLHANHQISGSTWIRVFKKASGRSTVTFDEVLECTLAYGWSDSRLGSTRMGSYAFGFRHIGHMLGPLGSLISPTTSKPWRR